MQSLLRLIYPSQCISCDALLVQDTGRQIDVIVSIKVADEFVGTDAHLVCEVLENRGVGIDDVFVEEERDQEL